MPCWQGGPWLAVHVALHHMHHAPPLPRALIDNLQ